MHLLFNAFRSWAWFLMMLWYHWFPDCGDELPTGEPMPVPLDRTFRLTYDTPPARDGDVDGNTGLVLW